jgi:hypothetical protein
MSCPINQRVIAEFWPICQRILIKWIQHVLIWLDSWPAGLKLNTELSRFYSHTFINLIEIWGRACLFLHRRTHKPLRSGFLRTTSWEPIIYAKHALYHRDSKLSWDDNNDINLFWHAVPVYRTYLRLLSYFDHCIPPTAQDSRFSLEFISWYVVDFGNATLPNGWLYS